ncbi:hypothetical protein [Thioclava sp. F36-7]|uniref:hypothetical protein n=1 Tax=Thioclava sp. F36-7 TaxID=1915317 RepID=UPI0009977317|nr:hypothetical protein [Thioclava sp. F36-7]
MQWLSSAAVVGLFVGTVFYAWQRKLEHDFQFRKEKRELYRALITQIIALRDEVVGDRELFFRELRRLQGRAYETRLVAGNGLFDRVMLVRESLVDARLYFDGEGYEEGDILREESKLHRQINDFSDKFDALVRAMDADLRDTVEFLPRFDSFGESNKKV